MKSARQEIRRQLRLRRTRLEDSEATPNAFVSGRGLEALERVGIQVAYRLPQAVTHFFQIFAVQVRTVQPQHLMPVLDLGLQQKTSG